MEFGIRRIAEAYRKLFKDTKGFRTVSCLENTVGAGSTLGGPFEELSRLRAGVIELTGAVGDAYPLILAQTVNNGVKTLFILMALAVGVGIPNLLTRQESAKQMQLRRRKRPSR